MELFISSFNYVIFFYIYYFECVIEHIDLLLLYLLDELNLQSLWNVPYYFFPGGSDGKESVCNVGDLGSIPVWGRSPEVGNGNPLYYSCLENPMDRRAWQATVHSVTRVGQDLALSFFFFLTDSQPTSNALLTHWCQQLWCYINRKKKKSIAKALTSCESEVAQSCPTLVTTWTGAYQVPPSMGFSR